ncbi:DUF1203 domain-containing protein [Tsuneonella mangrovi]|uniref:DUF1203 domain-containing protein n=1 Tax=Tsuneonella mangrovi TaxID=1982042 RepID=UPI000BA1E386|nr:DUF1203 domain-containing protein [Tsuneonella mangrovi]
MTYRIRGLEPAQFAPLFEMDEVALESALASRVIAGPEGRYPCRVSLRDADPGEELVLVHFTNHAVDTPYRNAFAIFVRKDADAAAECVDALPPVLRGRPIALRCYAFDGTLHRAALALDDNVDAVLRDLLADEAVGYIDAHNAMHGCFAARIERYDGDCDV